MRIKGALKYTQVRQAVLDYCTSQKAVFINGTGKVLCEFLRRVFFFG